MWHIYKYVLKHAYRQRYIQVTYQMSCLEIIPSLYLHILYSVHIREFKHRWYQIHNADYCLKHFKLVFFLFPKQWYYSSLKWAKFNIFPFWASPSSELPKMSRNICWHPTRRMPITLSLSFVTQISNYE